MLTFGHSFLSIIEAEREKYVQVMGEMKRSSSVFTDSKEMCICCIPILYVYKEIKTKSK